MRIRRTITAALSTSLLLAGATACGDGDESGSDGGTPVTIASQNFPEAALVTSLYQVLLEENGYDVDTKLVDTRDAYMEKGQFPGAVDIVPEYLSAIGDFLNIQANGENAEPVTSNPGRGAGLRGPARLRGRPQ
jgi:osmoprotectant transport system substrate-binding protein